MKIRTKKQEEGRNLPPLKRIALVSAAILATISANATVVASVSLVIPQTAVGTAHAEQDFSFDYSLLVTGGTGTGYALLDLTLQGTTNETPYIAPWNFGGDASVSVTGAGAFPVSWWVPYGPQCPCIVPFTLGVPETLHFTGYAQAVLVATPGTDLSRITGGPITASVDFSGIRSILGPNGYTPMPAVSVSFTQMDVPEPSFACALLLIFLIVAGLRKRITNNLIE